MLNSYKKINITKDPNELYNEIFGLETKTLNTEKLKSRLENVKQKVSEKYHAFLT